MNNPRRALSETLAWQISLRSNIQAAEGLPTSVLTTAAPLGAEGMPDEVGILLPSGDGPSQLLDQVAAQPHCYADTIIGLFMANPFLSVSMTAKRLLDSGVVWVSNMPSVEQQDVDFSRQLADVQLDHSRELDSLSGLSGLGLRIAAIVADGPGAQAAAAIDPEIIIVLPRVADFAAGFPSLRQRNSAAQAVSDAAQNSGWSGLLLGLGESRDSEQMWPRCVDGILCRPITT